MPEKLLLTAFSFIDGERFGNDEGARSWEEVGVELRDPHAPPLFRWRAISDRSFKDFGRLDPMCRMSAAAVELLGVRFDRWEPKRREKVAITLGTSLGSLETDVRFYRTTAEEGGASPALFSYSLPSTAIAEVAIRYGLKGPNYCFLAGGESGLVALVEGARLVSDGDAEACVCIGCEAVTAGLIELFPELCPGSPRPASSAFAFLLESEKAASARSAEHLAVLRTGRRAIEDARGAADERPPARGGASARLLGNNELAGLCERLMRPAGPGGAALPLRVGPPGSAAFVLEPVA